MLTFSYSFILLKKEEEKYTGPDKNCVYSPTVVTLDTPKHLLS